MKILKKATLIMIVCLVVIFQVIGNIGNGIKASAASPLELYPFNNPGANPGSEDGNPSKYVTYPLTYENNNYKFIFKGTKSSVGIWASMIEFASHFTHEPVGKETKGTISVVDNNDIDQLFEPASIKIALEEQDGLPLTYNGGTITLKIRGIKSDNSYTPYVENIYTYTDIAGGLLESGKTFNLSSLGNVKRLEIAADNSKNIQIDGEDYFPFALVMNFSIYSIGSSSTSAPTVTTTVPATDVTATGATAGGDVTSDGGAAVTERGVVYGTMANPEIGTTDVTQVTANDAGTTGVFSVALSNLTENTTYHYRAYAINSKGIAYGADQVFTTQASIKSYTVTFNSNEGSSVTSQTVNQGETATLPTAPTKTGFIFDGWYSDADLNTPYVFNTPVTSNLSLYAKWSAIETDVTVTIGNVIAGQGQIVEIPVAINEPSTGIGAYGMQIDFDPDFIEVEEVISANSDDVIFDSKIFNEQGYLRVVWVDLTGGDALLTSATELFKIKLKVKDISPLGKSALTIDKKDIEKLEFVDATPEDITTYITADVVDGSVTVVNSYTIDFNSNNGSEVASQTVLENGKVIKPVAPTQAGYTFDGWYSDADLKNAYDFSMPITSNLSLYAKWTAVPSYSVNYNDNGSTGGTVPTDNNKYAKDVTATVKGNSGNLVKAGYTFTGWNTKADGSGTAYLPNATLTMGDENVTLYAQWTINKYDVTFDTNGGSTVNKMTIDYNNQITAPTPPTKAGYTFDGWYRDAELNTAYDFSTPITSNLTLYAKWTAVAAYSVLYHNNGSTGGSVPIDNGTYMKNALVTVASNSGNLVKEGYTFTGWNTQADGTGTAYLPYATLTMGENNINLYAQWTVNKHDVTFNTNGGSTVSAVTVEFNQTLTLPSPPTKAGFTFDGWYKDEDLSNQFDVSTPITNNMTLYAKWIIKQYDVIFETNGGSMVNKMTVNYNNQITAPTPPTKVGFTFGGWYSDADLKTTFDFSTAVTSHLTLYAKWTQVLTYSVLYDGNGSTGGAVPVDNTKYAKNEPVTVASNSGDLAKVGYTFTGWNTKADGTGTKYLPDASVKMGEANVTLYAQWTINQYDVTFETNGGSSVPAVTVEHNQSFLLPAAPTKAGYTFNGWYTDENLSSQFDTSTPITKDMTLYAKWTINKYDVNFDTNGGSIVSAIKVEHNQTITLPSAPTKAGYTFEGWYTDENLSNQFDDSTTVTKDMTLYAKWTIKRYDVIFETNGGSAVNKIIVEYNKQITAPTPPTKADYTFEGWYNDEDLKTAYDFSTPVTSKLSLYAKWTVIPTYSVLYNDNGSTGGAVPVDNTKYAKDASVTVAGNSGDLEKEGYAFADWNTKADGTGTKYLPNATLTMGEDNVTLYAQWTINQYDVTFETNGGSSVPAVTVEHNQSLLLPSAPTKAGYTFEGWYTDENLSNQFDGSTPITNNLTLYAKWKIKQYDVTFDTNGGSTVNKMTVDYNYQITAPSSPTKKGYTFEGWYSDEDLKNAYDFNTPITSNLSLYAKWTQVLTYSVLYDGNGSTGGAVPVDNTKYAKNETVTVASNSGDLAKVGYTFEGWNTKADGTGTAYLPNTMLKMGEGNVILYAQWTINKYDVTFETNGGSAVNKMTVDYNQILTVPTSPSKAGFTFAGWYKDASTTTKFDATTKITGNMTLYAKWTKIVSEDSSNPAPTTPTSPSTKPTTEEIVVDVVDDTNPNELLVRTPITRTKENGLVKDVVTFTPEKALESVGKLAGKDSKVSRIVIPDNKDEVSETAINVPKVAVSTLSNGETSLSIRTANASIFIPNTSLNTFTDNLYFRVVPVKKEEEKIAIETRAKQEEQVKEVVKVDNAKIEILGRPMTIETNMQNRPVTLTLPLPTKATQEQLKNLAVFIEHSDGTKEILRGRIVTFATGVQGVEFDVTHFSTFTVLYLEGAANYFAALDEDTAPVELNGKHNSYIQGYKDGTFRPNAAITRQQMAAMLARQLTKNEIPKVNHSSYNDISSEWAKDEIEYVRSVGIMTGTTADTFAPNNPITRAQMAAIAVRWIDKQCTENPKTAQHCTPMKEAKTFTDVPSTQWAAQYIARISEIGIMTGMEDGTFRPQEELTRAQAVKVLNRLFNRGPMTETISEKFSDVTSQHWAHDEIQEAAIDHDYAIVDGKEHVQH